MGAALTTLSQGLVRYWNASREPETHRERSSSPISLDDTASSSSAPSAVIDDAMLGVSVGSVDINPSEAAGHELPESARYSRRQFLEFAEARPHFIPGGRGRNGSVVVVVHRAWFELLVRRWRRDYQRHLDYDLEAGRQAHREAANLLQGVMVQAFAAFLPACVTSYPLFKDAPDYIKFKVFGGLAFCTVWLLVGLVSKSAVCRELAIRLVSFSAVAVLTFSVASQLSGPTYIALTAFAGVALNLIIMKLRF